MDYNFIVSLTVFLSSFLLFVTSSSPTTGNPGSVIVPQYGSLEKIQPKEILPTFAKLNEIE